MLETLPVNLATAPTGLTTPPAWIEPLLHGAPATVSRLGSVILNTRGTDSFTLLTATCPGIHTLGDAACTAAARELYTLLATTLKPLAACHPVRFWNHIPGIHDDVGNSHDRYMAFNAGRFAAFVDWVGGPQNFARSVATASGIGDHGEDLVVHVLAATSPGVAVTNPRQTPPFNYSKRYGRFPPCFARATWHENRLMIGGTASIRGEESMFIGELEKQLEETLVNIAALTTEASRLSARPFTLAGIQHFRTYHPRQEDRPALEAMLLRHFPQASFEWSPVPLCRRELLVEIEACALA